MINKIIQQSELTAKENEWVGKKVVLVGGCYDLLHYGHFSFLNASKKEGDLLVIALESDEFIKTRKNRSPVHTQNQRAEILAGLEFVDVVIKLPFMESSEDYERLVLAVQPAIIAVTEGDKNIEFKKQHADKVEGAVVKVVSPMVHSYSTSSIIAYANLLRD